jgi:GTP:adenosylcobinamide-phosphate guanylyltransferase
MDTDQTDYIRHRLQRYEESINETRDHFGQLESFGSYRACAPLYEKSGIPLLIDSLKSDREICDRFWQEYDRITQKLEAFRMIKGKIYQDMLYADLKNYVAAYHSALCYADLNVLCVEADHDLFNREAIRALLAELPINNETRETDSLVTTLDGLFLSMRKTVGATTITKLRVCERDENTNLVTREDQSIICGNEEQIRHF